MRYTSSRQNLEWPVTLTRPAVHLALRVGSGELLSTSNGSRFLDATGRTLSAAQGGRVSVTSPEFAAVHFAGSSSYPSTYGAFVPTWEVSATEQSDVYRMLIACPAETTERLSLYTAPLSSVTAYIVTADILRIIGAPGPVDLVLEATDSAGQLETHVLNLTIDDTPPTGDVQAVWAAGHTYLTYQRLTEDTEALLLTAPGLPVTRVPVTEPVTGLCEAAMPSAPTAVYAVDHAGNLSENLLSRHLNLSETDAATHQPKPTTFAPWPLPAYLNPQRPNLRALLDAFEKALDIGQDAAGDALSLKAAQGGELDRLSQFYGTARRAGELDQALTARVQARFTARKSTRQGLRALIRAAQGGEAQVTDAYAYLSNAHYLDGSWMLDGSVTLGGESLKYDMQPGQAAISLWNQPVSGWEAVTRIAHHYTAAGVVPTSHSLTLTHAVLGNSPRSELTLEETLPPDARRLTSLEILAYDNTLTLNGAWTLEGGETLDGTGGTATVTEL